MKKYKKHINLTYQVVESEKNNRIMTEQIKKLLIRLKEKQAKIHAWKKSEEYKKLCKQLLAKKSFLADFI